ncbi:hypothetical protein [Paenibacillus glacialis]|nr:hypothetical protein [Paenibacillus glacialis]
MLWFTLSTIMLFRIRRREYREIQEQIKQIKKLVNESNPLILFLDYRSPDFKEIDALLELELPSRITIVFYAPEWLIVAKRKRWAKHCVLSSTQVINLPDRGDLTFIAQDKNGKYKIFNDVSGFIRFFIQQKTQEKKTLEKLLPTERGVTK